MTDNEIIKALECCTGYNCENCKALKYYDYMHPEALARASLDLINRQNAKIERLEKIRAKQANIIGEERGQKYELLNKICKAKSEAIKEFTERLKAKKCGLFNRIDIDNLVKEMTEAEKTLEELN